MYYLKFQHYLSCLVCNSKISSCQFESSRKSSHIRIHTSFRLITKRYVPNITFLNDIPSFSRIKLQRRHIELPADATSSAAKKRLLLPKVMDISSLFLKLLYGKNCPLNSFCSRLLLEKKIFSPSTSPDLVFTSFWVPVVYDGLPCR